MTPSAYLLAYFHSESHEDGEQIRFAVSTGPRPTEWHELAGGRPILRSDVGERGARDPFLVRDERRGEFVLIATDLRTWPDDDWTRTTRTGSRSILVWRSTDLTDWSGPALVEVAPPDAGNAWAPKAFWSVSRDSWLVFWASALYEADADRAAGSYQRILVAETADFDRFSPARVHLDEGHDVIDMTFLPEGERWYRFSANAHAPGGSADLGNHIFMEAGESLDDVDFQPLVVDIGKPELERGEGPAVAPALDGPGSYLLIDEFGLRGYQLFTADSLASGRWTHVPDAALPAGARHGSLLPITDEEHRRLMEGYR